jgi:hypothetical protein
MAIENRPQTQQDLATSNDLIGRREFLFRSAGSIAAAGIVSSLPSELMLTPEESFLTAQGFSYGRSFF